MRRRRSVGKQPDDIDNEDNDNEDNDDDDENKDNEPSPEVTPHARTASARMTEGLDGPPGVRRHRSAP
jgi:hypothetical protein